MVNDGTQIKIFAWHPLILAQFPDLDLYPYLDHARRSKTHYPALRRDLLRD